MIDDGQLARRDGAAYANTDPLNAGTARKHVTQAASCPTGISPIWLGWIVEDYKLHSEISLISLIWAIHILPYDRASCIAIFRVGKFPHDSLLNHSENRSRLLVNRSTYALILMLPAR